MQTSLVGGVIVRQAALAPANELADFKVPVGPMICQGPSIAPEVQWLQGHQATSECLQQEQCAGQFRRLAPVQQFQYGQRTLHQPDVILGRARSPTVQRQKESQRNGSGIDQVKQLSSAYRWPCHHFLLQFGKGQCPGQVRFSQRGEGIGRVISPCPRRFVSPALQTDFSHSPGLDCFALQRVQVSDFRNLIRAPFSQARVRVVDTCRRLNRKPALYGAARRTGSGAKS